MHLATLKTRLAIALAAIACAVVAMFVSRIAHVPAVVGSDISLLRQPSSVVALIAVAVVTIASTTLVSMVIGRSRREAGLFCAAVGLIAFAAQGGSITSTLQYASGPGVLITLVVELVLLYAIVAAALFVSGKLAPTVTPVAATDEETPDLNHHLFAVAVQTVAMVIVMLVLGQSESKKHAMTAVGLAAYIGAIAAHYSFPVRNGLWLTIAPLPVGIVGYLLEYTKPTLLSIGLVDQPLATALPLHYVGAGIAGGILGHWMSQKWQAESLAQNGGSTTASATA